MAEDTNVRVAVRCRPFSKKEIGNGEVSCVKIEEGQIILTNPTGSNEEHSFAFDLVYGDDSKQTSLFQDVGTPILDKAFAGYNGTIFAYGQTGSGKTWSMQGADGPELQGIIPRMNNSLFERIEQEKKKLTTQFLVTVSYFEIYNEVIFDLLDASDRKKRPKAGLEIKEHPLLGVYVKGLQEIVVDNAPKLQSIIDQGMGNRTVASTQMNADSSRSHSVFMITVHQKDLKDKNKNIFAKVSLVDLAGSERVKSTGATGSTLKEGANINKSLSALGNVINALVEASKGKGTFIPYRNSKLTRVLQDSLGGNSVTAMLAAMSPAASNFEETLSTLKYANRAKAIKVKAVKNEEASQVSKLNDEIRMLRDKLMNQQNNNNNNEDTTAVMDEKQKQHLKELEEAMKNTWEEKAKISEAFEINRQKLLQEQQNSALQLEKSRERNWKLLEEKGDIEITMSHVKEQVSSKDSKFAGVLRDWGNYLREIMKLEKELSEQDTVVQVYRSSLSKDSNELIKKTTLVQATQGVSLWESSVISTIKQLRDKFGVLTSEISKWASVQDNLAKLLDAFAVQLESFSSSANDLDNQDTQTVVEPATDDTTEDCSAAATTELERKEISRGLKLICWQFMSKRDKDIESIATSRNAIVNFNSVSKEWLGLLDQYRQCVDVQEQHSSSPKKDLARIRSNIERCISDFELDAASAAMLIKTGSVRDNAAMATTTEGGKEEIHTTCVITDIRVRDYPYKGMPVLDGKNCWSGTVTQTNGMSDTNSGSGLLVEMMKPKVLSSVELQGGTVIVKCPSPESQDESDFSYCAPPVASSSEVMPLPCGVDINGCGGNVETTISAMADILDWGVLLKKNPPEKFLKRPPVRFMFDLIKHIADLYPNFFLPELNEGTWDVVGESKQTKINYIQKMIEHVSRYLSVQEPTSASAIVTGSDPELTNILLQQLAIAVYQHKNSQKLPGAGQEASKNTSSSATIVQTNTAVQRQHFVDVPVSSWPLMVQILVSLDGSSWSEGAVCSTNMRSASDKAVVDLPANIRSKFIKIVPLKCDFDTSSCKDGDTASAAASSASCMCAIRFQVNAVLNSSGASGDVTGAAAADQPVVAADLLFSSLKQHENVLDMLISAAEMLLRVEEAVKAAKQSEVQANLEKLVSEKVALEQLLASEKEALANDKQDLADQLKKCFNQLRETKGLLDKEQEINKQLEESKQQIEKQRCAQMMELTEKDAENSALKAEILRLQAIFERDKNLIKDMGELATEKEQQCESLQSSMAEMEQQYESLQSERDELAGQIDVLTEERDVARSHEEDLFEQLNERTQDLDTLQESYVDICDRFHDVQDEAADLRDKVDNLESMLQTVTSTMNTMRAAAAATAAVPTKPSPEPVGVRAAAPTVDKMSMSLDADIKLDGGEENNDAAQQHHSSQEQHLLRKQSKKERSMGSQSTSSLALPNSNNNPEPPPSDSGSHAADAKPRPPTNEVSPRYNDDFDDYEDEFEAED